MSTITLILEPNADGTLDLPLPLELRHGKVKIERNLNPAESARSAPHSGLAGLSGGTGSGMIWMAPDFDEPIDDFKEYME